MHVSCSCSNHTVSDAIPLVRYSKRRDNDCEHIPRARSQFPINTDHLLIRNAFSRIRVRITQKLFCALTLYQKFEKILYHVTLLYTRIAHQCARIVCVSGEICRSRYCSQYTLCRTAVRNYSTLNQVWIICACILPKASIIEFPSITYRPLRNLNSTQQ